MKELRHDRHTVSMLTDHMVFAPKYRGKMLVGDVAMICEGIICKTCVEMDIQVIEIAVNPDHVHIFMSFPPRYSIAKVVGMLKSISASEIFEKFPEVKKELWGGEFWEDGYFARTVGDKVTADLIKRYIKYHRDEIHGKQLKLF